MMATITLNDVGPVKHLDIPLPPGGGVVVLRGRNDIGKSEALSAVDALVSGTGTVEKRHGSVRGEISLGDARITVTKQARRSGSLEVSSLEGKFSVADLVEPGIDDPAKADTRRIKSLLQLSGAKADCSDFHALVGGKDVFDQIVRPERYKADDVVELAAGIKRDLEAASRKEEDLATHEEGHARGHREAAEGFDPSVETDAKELQAILEVAIQKESALASRAVSIAKQLQEAEDALEQLRVARDKYTGKTVNEAAIDLNAATVSLESAKSRVSDIRKELSDAEDTLAKADSEFKLATRESIRAQEFSNLVQAWTTSSSAAKTIVPIAPQDMIAAKESVTKARQALEHGALQREKADRQRKAADAEASAKAHRERAQALRDAARGTDDVLSSLVARSGSAFRVESGRLVTDVIKERQRVTVPYSELSDGTRWKIALDIAIDAVGERGLITIPQWAWGELDPINRREIDTHLRRREAHAITALATEDDELTAAALPPE